MSSAASYRCTPEDIDTVISTHADSDHREGTLDKTDQLIFGNAHYFIAKVVLYPLHLKYPEQAAASKHRICNRAAAEHGLVFSIISHLSHI